MNYKFIEFVKIEFLVVTLTYKNWTFKVRDKITDCSCFFQL